MYKPDYHIFVCNSFRLSGDPQGTCNRKDATSLLQYLEEEIADRGINAIVSSTGCLKACEKGPVVVVYPQAWWYGEVTQETADEILDALEAGEPADSLLLS